MSESAVYPEELLADLVDMVTESLVDLGINQEAARIGAFAATERLRKRWGGMQIYFPKGDHFEVTQRHLQVWKDFNGHNHKELAQRHGMSEQHVYRVLKEIGRIQMKMRQFDAFDDMAGKNHAL